MPYYGPTQSKQQILSLFFTELHPNVIDFNEGRSGDEKEVLRPTNTIAIVGNKITLPCTSRVNNESRWDFYAVDAIRPVHIYNGNRFGANIGRRITLDFNSCSFRTCHLSIDSVQLEDAGYYVCFESSSAARKAAALVVLGWL